MYYDVFINQIFPSNYLNSVVLMGSICYNVWVRGDICGIRVIFEKK